MLLKSICTSSYFWAFLSLSGAILFYSLDYHRKVILKLVSDIRDIKTTIETEFGSTASVHPNENENDRLFVEDELKIYTNLNNGLYLAILGQVFDVTKGADHYKPGAPYHAFTGRDASLSFITGVSTESELTDDVSSLTPRQVKSLFDWLQLYVKNYIYKGKLIGRYYNEEGHRTEELYKLQQILVQAEKEASNEERKKRSFPPCNIEWKPKVGTTVWCTTRSGGIERDWIGLPRMLYERPGSKQYRCACVDIRSEEYKENAGSFRMYDECPEDSTKCIIKQPDE